MNHSLVRAFFPAIALSLFALPLPAQRPLSLDDLPRLHTVSDPRVSPDGKWIVYSVSAADAAGDKNISNLTMVSWDGTQTIPLTYSPEGASTPRWSPDGNFLAFLSARPGKAKGTQIWIIDRRGGEARQFTDLKERISDYDWSPDSKRMVMVLREATEPEPDPTKPPPAPKPIVIDRYHFKQDMQGYLSGTGRGRIYLYDLASRKAEPLTPDTTFDETNPAFSPDGTKIAFVSNRDANADRSRNTDVFVADAKARTAPRRLTSYAGPDGGRLAWSPDSTHVAYVQGSEMKFSAYNMDRLAIVPVNGGAPRVLTTKLDRAASAPSFSEDGKSILCLIADDRTEYPARVDVATGGVERLMTGARVIMAQNRAGGHSAVLAATDLLPGEIFAMEGGSLRKLTAVNDTLMSEIKLGVTEDIAFKSKDGTEVHGLLTLPAGYSKGKRIPTLLRIHGGPNGQDAHQFQFERQFFAAHGYAVVSVNYRGSSGRGTEYQTSIFADWGNKEVQDLLAGVDHVVKMGVADPDRLGIGGWSYGGILTDYTIATDGRFKAAISGAGSANQISMYGVDQYTLQYDNEIGPPWKNPDAWVKISYPFFHADRIHTPTLFMGGDKDFNVPIIGGEQMYQALQSLNVPTQLVVYPGQFHGFTRPSFIRDRYERYLAWYDKYLGPKTT